MGKDDSEILRLAERHVFDLFRNGNGTSSLVYHGFKRSRALVDDSKEIAKGSKLNGAEGQVLMLSAWFHDAAFAVNGGGREKSIEIARAFSRPPRAARKPRRRRRRLREGARRG